MEWLENIIDAMRAGYQELKKDWPGYKSYDGFMKSKINNARLAAVATYNEWVPAFTQLLHDCDNDLKLFYQRSAEIGDLPKEERLARMDELVEKARINQPLKSRLAQ